MCSDSDIVEDTESHCAIGFGVMPGRTYNSEGVFCITVHHDACAGNDSACCKQSIVKRRLSHVCGGVINDPWGFFAADLFQRSNKLGMMNQADLIARSGPHIQQFCIEGFKSRL